jgi:Winged helix DNA-binding domain
MTPPIIAHRRLAPQRLTHSTATTPADVVGWLGAVQSQDYAGAKWSLGMRMPYATDAAIEQAFADGAILRTHVMRPTWHFVVPADIRWMLALTAPRVKATLAYNDRQWCLDPALIARGIAVIADVLSGQQLTRAELGAALTAAGIAVDGYRLGQLMSHAELDGVVCSGARRGKQFTYALLDERVPPAPVLPRDAAVTELARRYFVGHGPATARDFVWWSGLTAADARAGLDALGSELESTTIDGETYWFAAAPASVGPVDTAWLLPTFDEFMVGYAGFDHTRRGGAANDLVFESTIMIAGQMVGSWRRTLAKRAVLIELAPFAPFTTQQTAAVQAAAQRFADFVGLPLRIAEHAA